MKVSKSNLSHNNEYFHTEKLKADLRKRAVVGAGATVFSQVSVYGIQMIGVIILARLLTPDDFGLIAMVMAFFVIFKMFRNLGLTDATIQKDEINHKQISTLFWINIAFSLVVTLFFMSLSPLIAWFYKQPSLKLITIVISLDFIFGGISTQHRALLKRNLQMYRITAIQVGGTFISFTTAIVFAWKGYGYWALVARHVVYAMLEAVGAWMFCRWRPGLPAFGTGVRPMLRFGVNMLGNFSISTFTQNLDKILIGWCYGTQSLGYYHKAYHLFMAPAQQLSYPLTSVAVTTLSRLSNEHEKYRRYYLNAFSMLAFVGFPISSILTIMGSDIILLLLGPQWTRSSEIFSVFGIGIGTQILYSTHAWLHISMGRTDRWLRWNIIGSIVTIIFFLIGLPFGALGVAVGYIIALHILIFPALWYAGKPINLKLHVIISKIWKYYVSALGAGLLCWFVLYSFYLTSNIFVELNIFVRLLSTFILFISIYLLFIITLCKDSKPISQFTSVVRDMVPSVLSRKSKE